MAFTKILDSDVADKGVIGLPDTPNLSTQAMQEKFDEIALDVLKPKHNELIDELEAGTAAASLGAIKNGEATTIQDILDDMSAQGYTKEETDVLLSGKVDKEEGKGLSTYDFSDGYKYKIDNIEDNANNYVLPIATGDTLGGIKPDNETATVDINGVLHVVGGGGGGGTNNYEALINLPVYNGKTIFGDHPSEYYGVLRPYLLITTDAGSTVTITNGIETITATQVSGSTTQWECKPTAYGTWTVKSELAGADDAVTTVDIDAVKTYAVTVSHMTATITVTYPAGSTSCTLTKGDLTYTATQNPQTFTVRSAGTWTVTCVYNGITKTATAIISSDGDSQSVTIEYASITVNYGNDFKGKTITCTDGDLTYTKTAPNDASSVVFTIPTTGTWTVSATVSGTPYSQSVVVSSYTTYSTTLEVFEATVTITFPYSNGATCTITDGDTTLSADDSPMAFSIPNTGTWTATCTLDGIAKTQSFVITTEGQTESHTFSYGTINLTYSNEFRGISLTCTDGVTTITKTAPISGNTMTFYPPNTGTWTISGIYSGVTYSSGSITVSSLSTAVSATIQTLVSITVTIYGAKQDTITFTDAAGTAHTVTFASGATSKSESLKVNPTGTTSITFTSSVSKNPSNLSQNYSKNVSLTASTTSVYVMPNIVVYWYGYQPNNYTAINNNQDGSIISNTRDITISRNGNQNLETGFAYSARSIASYSNFKAIIDYTCTPGTGLTRNCNVGVGTNNTTYVSYSAQAQKTSSYSGLIDVSVSSLTSSLSPAVTIANGGTGAGNSVKVSAIWFE